MQHKLLIVRKSTSRTGLTLIELVVVLTILAALATLLIPRLTGITDRTGTASSAAILQEVSSTEGRFEAQFSKIPTSWDGVVTSAGALYTKLNPKLVGDIDGKGTTVTAGTLTATQAQSLIDAGMTGLHYQDEAWTGSPSDSGRTFGAIADGAKVAILQLPTTTVTGGTFSAIGHNVLFSDKAFSIHPYTGLWNNTFIVVGFGNESSLKRNSAQDTPLFASSDPTKYYSRALCVFMVPPSSVTATTDSAYFKARYIGCFAPDATCLMDNLNSVNRSQTPN